MSITIERNRATGAWLVTALVRQDGTPFAWYETGHLMGYTKREAVQTFRQYLKEAKMEIVK
jgi:hypothetical protein